MSISCDYNNEKVADSWTNECIKWYDIYLDEMYPESDF